MSGTFIFSFQLSGWVGRSIVIILFLISIYSWTIILKKFFLFRRVRRATRRFLAASPMGGSNLSLFSEEKQKVRKFVHSPLFSLYQKGCSVLSSPLKGERKKISFSEIEEIRNLLETGAAKELSSLENSLVVLATTTTLSPFLGLLGTVWGILKAFLSMGLEGSAGIETVAPGIAEALITTVVGLVVAIPALVFYNYFTNHLKNFANELDSFNSEFISFLKRHYAIGYETIPKV
ncbi:MAG: MotA/TolQ/ExbB proton channel family protein [Candidatus Omnitrophica bacterium]|nr:MotA/TolQ/ExbB proton channel family protein [Candidatus Omnitrophota bacterium]